MKKISILGSTGSIGKQALEVCDIDPSLEVVALTAHSNVALLEEQIRKYKPKIAALSDEKLADELRVKVKDTNVKIVSTTEGICECASIEEADIVLTAIVGIAGLKPTIAAINAKKDIALSNKETLVTAGDIVMKMAKEKGVKIIPVDSEHSAVFQSISNQDKFVDRLILTASGGPFFGKTKDELKNITKFDALKHPNWDMGAKITIDSATLVNKGLEIIEAMHLFNIGVDNIDVVVHRESIIHSLVEFCDGSVIGQLGNPDMKLPISYALHYPERAMKVSERLNLSKIAKLTFFDVDYETFPAINLAKEAAREGGVMPCVLNGANEAAVSAFLNDKCGFLDIYSYIETAMGKCKNILNPSLSDIIDSDAYAREVVNSLIR